MEDDKIEQIIQAKATLSGEWAQAWATLQLAYAVRYVGNAFYGTMDDFNGMPRIAAALEYLGKIGAAK
jgi:hypothetical protein